MSNPINPFSNVLNIQTIQAIDQMNLPVIQKHHLRILAHCLILLKDIFGQNNFSSDQENLLREWCNNQSQKFNDQKFNDLLYDQLIATSKKLSKFSQKLGKNLKDLEIEDLVLLVKEDAENRQ